jgi:hypothetical protein
LGIGWEMELEKIVEFVFGIGFICFLKVIKRYSGIYHKKFIIDRQQSEVKDYFGCLCG